MKLPVKQNYLNNYQKTYKGSNRTIFCFAYQEDLDQAYAFYCSRYENISYKDFMNLGLFEFKKKLGSIPKTEPLYDIIKSRTINIAKIKDREERKYWREMRRINQIPQIFLSTKEIDSILKENIGNGKNIKK